MLVFVSGFLIPIASIGLSSISAVFLGFSIWVLNFTSGIPHSFLFGSLLQKNRNHWNQGRIVIMTTKILHLNQRFKPISWSLLVFAERIDHIHRNPRNPRTKLKGCLLKKAMIHRYAIGKAIWVIKKYGSLLSLPSKLNNQSKAFKLMGICSLVSFQVSSEASKCWCFFIKWWFTNW